MNPVIIGRIDIPTTPSRHSQFSCADCGCAIGRNTTPIIITRIEADGSRHNREICESCYEELLGYDEPYNIFDGHSR